MCKYTHFPHNPPLFGKKFSKKLSTHLLIIIYSTDLQQYNILLILVGEHRFAKPEFTMVAFFRFPCPFRPFGRATSLPSKAHPSLPPRPIFPSLFIRIGPAFPTLTECLQKLPFQCLKTGVSHTYTTGLSHTPTIGVTHTCFEALEGDIVTVFRHPPSPSSVSSFSAVESHPYKESPSPSFLSQKGRLPHFYPKIFLYVRKKCLLCRRKQKTRYHIKAKQI